MSSALFDKVQAEVSPQALGEMMGIAQRVEEELTFQLGSAVSLVEQIGLLTLEGGGKRLRPLMAAAGARAINPNVCLDRAVKLGACLEMIHMATLIHDDVIDGSATRRGRPTASVVHGGTASVLSGDVLLAKAMKMLAEDGDLAIIRLVSQSVVEMAEGEVREVEVRGDFDLGEDCHMAILRMKTASFIEACCRTGARMGGATKEQEEALGSFGHHIGMAFQIADDILDFRGDKAKTGKPQATDFREGCATLPLIALRGRLTEEEMLFVRRKFGNGVTDDEVAMIGRWMDARGAFAESIQRADDHVSAALEQLQILPASPYRTMLESVSGFVVTRES
jgi:octaprenyl-diphosphate synthase